MSKVAIASTDGVLINEHFGRAKEFYLYEVQESGEYSFLERRKITYDHNNNTHVSHAAIGQLADVAVVLASQIGPGAEQELRSKKIIPFCVTGPIDKALKALATRGKILRNSVRFTKSADCHGGCDCGTDAYYNI
jgi:nitrogen fixation protein NifB